MTNILVVSCQRVVSIFIYKTCISDQDKLLTELERGVMIVKVVEQKTGLSDVINTGLSAINQGKILVIWSELLFDPSLSLLRGTGL